MQDEEHPRIILSNFTLAVSKGPLKTGEWAAISLAIVLVPLLLVLAVQKCRRYSSMALIQPLLRKQLLKE